MELTLAQLNEAGAGSFPGCSASSSTTLADGVVRARLDARGEAHGAERLPPRRRRSSALADTACGYGCILSLPEGATGFTTIELKTNFLRSAREGTIDCEARLVHGGRTTQLWDATVSDPGRARDGALPLHAARAALAPAAACSRAP